MTPCEVHEVRLTVGAPGRYVPQLSTNPSCNVCTAYMLLHVLQELVYITPAVCTTYDNSEARYKFTEEAVSIYGQGVEGTRPLCYSQCA